MSSGNRPNEADTTDSQRVTGLSPASGFNVCHIVSGDRWAGAEVQVAALLKYLSRQKDLNLSAVLLNPGRLADEITYCGIEVKVVPEGVHSFRSILREATGFVRGKGIRVLHSHRYKENLLAALLARRCGIPVVVRTQHGLPEPLQGRRRAKQAMVHLLDRCVARWATDRVISVSSEMTDFLSSQCPRAKIATIPNGIDLESVRSKFSKAEARTRLGVPEDFKMIGTAGRLEPIKRLDLFLEMARLVRDRRSDVRFVVAGEGREESRLRALTENLGIQDDVMFLGHRDDVFDVLRALDIMVLSSDHEGMPMVLLEAMALGVLVVARAVGGIPEVIQRDVSGVLVNSSDPAALAESCLKALDDAESSRRMTEAAQTLVQEKFSAERTAGEVRLLYNSCS